MAAGGGAVVVTGADGFVGAAACAHLSDRGWRVRRAVRAARGAAACPDTVVVGDLAAADGERLAALVAGAAAVVHLAGRAHVVDDDPAAAPARFEAANVVATARVADAAVRAGVRRFVFASTVKVNGEASPDGRALSPADPPAPADAYGESKLRAEEALLAATAGTSTSATILRLPLVYGPGVRANFAALLDAVARGRPLPLGLLANRRSVLFSGNLASAIEAALSCDPPAQGLHFVADALAPTVTELTVAIGAALGVPARLLPVPPALLRVAGRVLGRQAAVQRLTGSLVVDTAGFREAAHWSPPHVLAEGLAVTARWWRARHSI